MSADNNNDGLDTSCCAACGIAAVDEIKLKECDDCDLVKYCSDECQHNHKSQHKKECKKRAAELRDVLLFKQPESGNLGDCPICCLPLPLSIDKSLMYHCCSKLICNGCALANVMRELEQRRSPLCPFCRDPSITDEESDKRRMKRVEANDPVAFRQEGMEQYKKGEYIKAFEYWTKGAELGDAESQYQLAGLYNEGDGVEVDIGKETHHLEEAAIGGHPHARYLLGRYEFNDGNAARAVKHWIIAAKQGDDNSMKKLLEVFKAGFMEKDDLTAALRAHKAAVDATKSPQRRAAEAAKGC